jgi:hypothetical protein
MFNPHTGGSTMNTINTQKQHGKNPVESVPLSNSPLTAGSSTSMLAFCDFLLASEIEKMDWPEDVKRDQRRRNLCGSGFSMVRRITALGLIAFQKTWPDGKIWVQGFSVNRMKYDFFYSFKTQQRADAFLDSWQAKCESQRQAKDERKAARAEALKKPHGLKIGDVLSASWGYEQTNIDYYQVTRLVGKRSVEIREIGQNSENTGWLQGVCTPSKDRFIGDPMVKRVDETGHVKVRDCGVWASKETPLIVAGVEIFRERHWTAYA